MYELVALVHAALQCGTASLTLRDQDQTNRREGDWTKVNTLGHYNVDEMVRVVKTPYTFVWSSDYSTAYLCSRVCVA